MVSQVIISDSTSECASIGMFFFIYCFGFTYILRCSLFHQVFSLVSEIYFESVPFPDLDPFWYPHPPKRQSNLTSDCSRNIKCLVKEWPRSAIGILNLVVLIEVKYPLSKSHQLSITWFIGRIQSFSWVL